MTEQLREALADLTDRPVPPPPASDSLWRRGRRRHRARQLAATAASFAVVAAGGAWWTSSGISGTELGPVNAPAERLHIPDALHRPDGWTRTIARSGAPGPLSVVARTESRDFWLRSEERWFGVSGQDQTYHWLDLPGMAEDESAGIALSPDGRYLGYHLGGEPRGTVVRSDIVGLAVYDTVTGAVTERRIPSKHGLSVDFDGLTWSADSTYLVTTYAQLRRQMGSSTSPVTESWRPATDTVQELSALGDGAGSSTESSLQAWGDSLWTWIGGRMVRVDPRTGTVQRVDSPPARSPVLVPGPPVLNPVGTRVVYVGTRKTRGAFFPALYSAQVAEDGSVGQHSRLAEQREKSAESSRFVHDVVGWADRRTVLVRANNHLDPGPESDIREAVVAWDVVDGGTRVAIQLDDATFDLQLADAATRNPFVDTRSWRVPAPPPLVVLVGVTAFLVVGLWRLARRRRQGIAAADRTEVDA